MSFSTIFRPKTLDDERHQAQDEDMAHPLAAQVQPLIDEWLASDDGIIAEYEVELTRMPLAS